MARINISIPDKTDFTTFLKVRITDLNYGKHLGNDRMVSLIHEARFRFFKNLGFEELDIDGASILISDLAVIYKAEAFYGDILKFEICVDEFNKYGCDMFYNITREQDNKNVASAKTGMVFLYNGHLTAPPEKFMAFFV